MTTGSLHGHCVRSESWPASVLLVSLCVVLWQGVQAFDLSYTIREELEVGTPIANLGRESNISRLLSQQDFNSLVYAILSYPDDDATLFELDSFGVVRTAARIDRDKLCRFAPQCQLSLHASARTPSGQQFFTFQVTVVVQDINDNPPTFSPDSYAVRIDEDVATLTDIQIVSAMDDDVHQNGLERYVLETPSEKFGLKVTRNLDNSLVPQLYVKSPLDRETQSFYQLTVLAQDGGRPQLSGKLQVNVTLGDVNDNAPRFLQSRYRVNVTETTPKDTRILKLEAEDLDIGINGRIMYRLGLRQSQESFRLFRVSADTGHVVTVRDLTPFQAKTFNLIVEAVDGGSKPLAAQAEVKVTILDSVNNAPEIRMTLPPQKSKVSSVDEDARRGFVVGHFIVDDSDTGLNGEVRCYLDDSTRWGALAAETFGLQRLRESEYKVTVYRPMDRETTPSYQVAIECRDNGSPALKANETFSVTLRDVNDFAPLFSHPVRRASLAENSLNDFVLRLEATDRDLGVNKVIRYGLGNVTSLVATYIKVDPETGEITTRKSLDRELFSTLDFQVVAMDTGDPPMTSTSRVVITVLDQNDNYPRVPLGYSLAVPENRPPWTVIGQIEAIDPDLGPAGEVIYQLMSDNKATQMFNLTQDGLLRTLRSFDREHRDLYDISVLASDSATSNPLTNLLHIRVQIADDNDHAPEFHFPRTGNSTTLTNTDALVNATLGYLQARDRDAGENSTLHYTVLDDGGLDILRADHGTGRLYTSRNLRAGDVGEHTVTVFVRDLGVRPLTATGTLHLVVRLGNGSLAAQGSDSRLGTEEHVIIVAILVTVALLIALCVFLVVLAVFRRDARQRRLKYAEGLQMGPKNRTPTPETGGADVMTPMCTVDGVGSAVEDGTWRKYNKIGGPGGVAYDVEDDVIMFKLKLAEQYRELEPEDKETCVETSSRSTSVLSEAVDGGAGLDPKSSALVSGSATRLATFHSGDSTLGKTGPAGSRDCGDKVWREGNQEMQSSSSRDTTGADSGHCASEDGSQGPNSTTDDSFPTDRAAINSQTAYASHGRGDYSAKRGGISSFERPPLLKTFQSSGNSRNSPGPGSTLPSSKVRREVTLSPRPGTNAGGSETMSPYHSMTSLKHVTGSPTSPAPNEHGVYRGAGSPGMPDKLRTSELYQKRAAKSDKPTGLDDTILKRLVINGRKLTRDSARPDDDGYCSNAPSGESVRDTEFPYPPPPSSTSSPRDVRLCSEPPVSPYTKMSSLPPFTYQEVSATPCPYPDADNTVPKHMRAMPQPLAAGSSPVGPRSNWSQTSSRSSPANHRVGTAFSPYTTPSSQAPGTREPGRLASLNPSESSVTLEHRNLPGHNDVMNDSLETQGDSHNTTTSGSYVIDEGQMSVAPKPANVYV